jgi:hypothetical protein
MNQFMNEDLMWERLKDIQREIENHRLETPAANRSVLRLARLLGERVWWLAGLAARRAPRPHPAARVEEARSARDAAA